MNSLVAFAVLLTILHTAIADNPTCRLCAYKVENNNEKPTEFCKELGFDGSPFPAACCDRRCLSMDESDADWPSECETNKEERCYSVELIDEERDDVVLAASRGGAEKDSYVKTWNNVEIGDDQKIKTMTCKKDLCNGATAFNAVLVLPALIASYLIFLRH